MTLQDREPAIDLFQQNYARQFVGDRDSTQRNRVLGGAASRFSESIGGSDCEHQGQRIAILQAAQTHRAKEDGWTASMEAGKTI